MCQLLLLVRLGETAEPLSGSCFQPDVQTMGPRAGESVGPNAISPDQINALLAKFRCGPGNAIGSDCTGVSGEVFDADGTGLRVHDEQPSSTRTVTADNRR